ncbi:heparinase II/III-family protein [Candidatus Pelagibacter sp.]|nr:heparinase II/III-family protein [Candidatus Pelagibacter sp.]
MLVNEFFETLNEFTEIIKKKFRGIYQKSSLYEKKISKTFNNEFIYKPSPHLLSSIIKYQNKKYKIEDFELETVWNSQIKPKDFEKLNNFFWFFSLDLKSSKKSAQEVISNWINKNNKYKKESWEFNITAKRIISWLSNHQLSYNESDEEYRSIFDHMIQKQTNHLLNEIKNSEDLENKIIGCSAIILTGLCYKIEKNYLNVGLNFLKKITNSSIDNQGFTNSRNIKQLIFFLKYFIIIREWFKESQIEVPEHIEENIYYLGQSYAFIRQNINTDLLFNGNNKSNTHDFDHYLKRLGYKFKNENKDCGGYIVLKNKKICLAMDAGSSPNPKYTQDYQSGALSFEIISNGRKLITNCGYYKKNNQNLNEISKSSAAHSTLIIDDNSSCKFTKKKDKLILKSGFKITQKNSVFEKNYWKINAAHDGYFKKFKSIHERNIEFFPKQMKFIGNDKIIRKKNNYNFKFDIRFHLEPNIKLMKTQDNKSILIELEDEGWKFTCDNYEINIDNGLYFGNKNSYIENQNIFVSGTLNNNEENIKWEIKKI